MRRHFSIHAFRHHSALAWLHVPSSRITPSMSLSDRTLTVFESALAIDRDHLGVRFEVGNLRGAEVKDRPALRIDSAAEDLGETGPGQSNLERRVLQMQRRQPGRSERPVLLLRMLEDQKLDAVIDRRDVGADAQRLGLAAVGTLGDLSGAPARRLQVRNAGTFKAYTPPDGLCPCRR